MIGTGERRRGRSALPARLHRRPDAGRRPTAPHDLDAEDARANSADMGVALIDGPIEAIEPGDESIALVTAERTS